MTNKELMRKATIVTDTFVDSGLSEEQASKFIDYVVDETSVKTKVRVEKFKASQRSIYKLGLADRVMVPKDEAADPGVRFGVTSTSIDLTPKRVTTPFELSDETISRTVGTGDVEDQVVRMMATQFANNLEQLLWDGHKTIGTARLQSDLVPGGSSTLYRLDSLIALFDGWLQLALANGHTVDAQNAPLEPLLLSRLLNAVPSKYKKDKSKWGFMASPEYAQAYAAYLSGRQDKAGTDALEGRIAKPFGVGLDEVALIDAQPYYAEHVVVNTDGTTATSLAHAPITSLVVTTSTLGVNPEAAYVLDTDYSADLTAGTITRLTGGDIGSGATVKVTYKTAGKVLASLWKNLIMAIGLDIKIKSQENIMKDVKEYAIHADVFCEFEEYDAVGLLMNLKSPY